MKRLLGITLTLLLLGSAGFGLNQYRAAQALQRDLAALGQEKLALQNRLLELQKRNATPERHEWETAAPADPSPITDETAPGLPPREMSAGPMGVRDRFREDRGRFEALLASPEVQRLIAMEQKSRLDGRYADLFKRLQLSPADLEKFKTLLVEKQAAVTDVSAAARTAGLNGRENRDQMRQLVAEAQAEIDNAMRSTLGEGVFAQYQAYEATQAERGVVNQLGQRLSYSAAPLTDVQSQYLVQILSESANTAQSGGNNRGASGSRITDDTLARAQGVLSPQQLSALQSLQQEQQAAAQLRQQMRANAQNRSRAVPLSQ